MTEKWIFHPGSNISLIVDLIIFSSYFHFVVEKLNERCKISYFINQEPYLFSLLLPKCITFLMVDMELRLLINYVNKILDRLSFVIFCLGFMEMILNTSLMPIYYSCFRSSSGIILFKHAH